MKYKAFVLKLDTERNGKSWLISLSIILKIKYNNY